MVLWFMLKLVRAVIAWNLNICWRLVVLFIGLVTLPARALSALEREKWVENQLETLQIEVGNLLWSHKELGTSLHYAIKERHVLESFLAELEDEHEKAVKKVELLEKEIEKLKCQNLQLREAQVKGLWDFKSRDNNRLEGQTGSQSEASSKITDEIRPPNHGDSRAECSAFQVHATVKYSTVNNSDNRMESDQTGLVEPVVIASNIYTEETLYQRRKAAWSQSLFSALLSLLVGMITWKTENPCMPLVIALFIVVGMSMDSVIRLFSTVTTKPSSDVVALLCFNWFLLGNLTYPTLPRLAPLLSPLVTMLSTQMQSVIHSAYRFARDISCGKVKCT